MTIQKTRVNEAARIVNGSRKPTEAVVADFVGRQNATRWANLTKFISANYPGVFNIEWLFGGKNQGWTLRYKKSKSFCNLIPEQGRFRVLLVFGGIERRKVEDILDSLISHVREDYQKAKTYHDGKWLFVNVDSAKVLSDIKRLLILKRHPEPRSQTAPSRAARRGQHHGLKEINESL